MVLEVTGRVCGGDVEYERIVKVVLTIESEINTVYVLRESVGP